LGHAVFEDPQSRGIGTGEGEVESTIMVVVEEGKGAGILGTIDSTDERLVGEAVGRSDEKAIAFVSAKGIASERRASGFVLLDP